MAYWRRRIEFPQAPVLSTRFSKDSSETNQGSPYKTSTSVRFNQRPLIYLTSLLLRRGLCSVSLSSLFPALFSIYHSVYQCRGVSEPCHQSSALCVALTDPLHLTAPVWLLLARRWCLIDGCPNCNYSASLSLAWCGHERAAGWERHTSC